MSQNLGKKLIVLQQQINALKATIGIINTENHFDATINFSVNANPNTAGTTYSPNTPGLITKIYVSTIDGSQWTYNGTAYVLYIAPYWSKNGNSGTTPGTHFIGTTDNKNLHFKINNINAGRISVIGDTFFGYMAGNAFPANSVQTNVGIGGLSLANLTNPGGAIGGNTAIGTSTLLSNIIGINNTALGLFSLTRTTSSGNVGLGAMSGQWNVGGSNQVFINSIDRLTYLGDQTGSPIYIQQNSTVASQQIFTNGALLNLSGTTRNIITSAAGSIINGITIGTATITTNKIATIVNYYADGTNGAGLTALASGLGSFISGNGSFNTTTATPAVVTTSGNGSAFIGSISGGTILASGQASFIQGVASRGGTMTASGAGSSILGGAIGTTGFAVMISSGLGSMARGQCQDTGTISATGDGSLASGRCSGPSVGTANLRATGQGSHAYGNAETGGDIIAGGAGGTFVFGNAQADSEISTTGGSHGSVAMGYGSGGTITTSGNGSFVGGYAVGTTLSNTGDGSFLWGYGFANTLSSAFKVGWGSVSFAVTGNNVATPNIPEYATKAAALVGGLTAGMYYTLPLTIATSPITDNNRVICMV